MSPITPGFYGKLPAHGDFVARRLPRSFITPWDRWLQALIRHSRGDLGRDWLGYYLESPFWRFLLGAGVCGDDPMAGVLMPSMDRGGRYFFLTCAAPIPAGLALSLAECHQPWFQTLEALSRQALDENLDADQLAQRLDDPDLALEPAGPTPTPADCWHYSLAVGDELGQALTALGTDLLAHALLSGSLWWTTGSPRVQARLLYYREGLAPPEHGVGFVAGRW